MTTNLMTEYRRRFMNERPDWNVMGPKLPAWFRHRLKRIDPRLRLQFLPPRDVVAGGVDPNQYPDGVWVICRKLRNTGMLYGVWTWALADANGYFARPDLDTIKLLRRARDYQRRHQATLLEDEFDRSLAAIRREQSRHSRAQLVERMANRMRRYNVSQYGSRRVSLHGCVS